MIDPPSGYRTTGKPSTALKLMFLQMSKLPFAQIAQHSWTGCVYCLLFGDHGGRLLAPFEPWQNVRADHIGSVMQGQPRSSSVLHGPERHPLPTRLACAAGTRSAVPYTASTALAKRESMQWQQRASSVERFGLTNAVMAMRKSPLQMVCLHGPRQRARLVGATSIL